MLRNKRGRDNERPAHHDEEWPPLAATRESPRTETETQHSHKKKEKKKKYISQILKKKKEGKLYVMVFVTLGIFTILKGSIVVCPRNVYSSTHPHDESIHRRIYKSEVISVQRKIQLIAYIFPEIMCLTYCKQDT